MTVAAWRASPICRASGGRHRPGGKMVQPMVTETQMGQEGTGL
jgi:hypothetical protein